MATHKGSLGTSGASHTTVLRLSFARKGKLTSVGWPERTSPSQTSPNWGGGMKHRFEGRTRQRATRLPSARVRACPHAMVSTVSPADVVMRLAAVVGGSAVARDGGDDDDSVACASTTAAAGASSESVGCSTGILVRASASAGCGQRRSDSLAPTTAVQLGCFRLASCLGCVPTGAPAACSIARSRTSRSLRRRAHHSPLPRLLLLLRRLRCRRNVQPHPGASMPLLRSDSNKPGSRGCRNRRRQHLPLSTPTLPPLPRKGRPSQRHRLL
jgi:hypothetical protein